MNVLTFEQVGSDKAVSVEITMAINDDSVPENTSPVFRPGVALRRAAGASLWCLCLQFFVVEQIAANGWATPYSWANNFISDLGVTECANRPPDSTHFVCSPLHVAMNGSFIVQGLLIAGGAALNRTAFPAGRLRGTGLILLTLAGAGVIAVGFAPADVHLFTHYAGAGIHFVGGNAGMILLGAALLRQPAGKLALPRAFGVLSLLAGSVGLVALALLVGGQYLGLGVGGMERVVAYPLPLVLAGIGVFLLAHWWSSPSPIFRSSSAREKKGKERYTVSTDDER